MTYLELCQFAHRYIGGGNALPGTAPTTVIGQVGELFELVKSVADAYRAIQNDQDQWRFMQKQGVFSLPAAARTRTRAELIVQVADYDDIRADLFGAGHRFMQMYSVASGSTSNTPVIYVPYQPWRGTVDQNAIPVGKPNLFTTRPDQTVEFNFTADQDYSFVCDYKRQIVTWVQTDGSTPGSANAQTPIFPERFHEMVAWRAIMFWGGSIQDPGKYQFARDEYNRIMAEMRADQLPEMLVYTNAFYGGAGSVGGGF